MKKRVFKCLLALTLVLSMVAAYSLNVSAADMAYNIYADHQTNGETLFDTFSIDFLSNETPYYTYWALANFHLYTSSQSLSKYKGLSEGGGYAGLQDRGPREGYGHSAIMSFWERTYKDGTKTEILRASRVYPEGDESEFGGEGEGTNWITPYDWKEGQWYRMIIHTWNDLERGTTFAGQWFQDLTTGEYTLISYFDTKLINSCWQGSFSFFMENYVGSTSDQQRDMQLKNIYMKKHSDRTWMSVTSSVLSHCNNRANNKIGAHSFGSTQEYFWGKSGTYVEDQAAYDKANPIKGTFSITQPETPTFGSPTLNSITLTKSEDGVWSANWEMERTGTPQLTYFIDVKDVEGNRIFTKNASRPEVVSEVLEGVATDAFSCRIVVTDVFGETTTLTETTDLYKELVPEEPETPEEPDIPEEPDVQEAPKAEKKDNAIVIGVIAVAAVVVIGGVGAGVVLAKKKKN